MNTVDYIILAVIVLVLGLAIWSVCKAKKSGKKCMGCPDSCACTAGNCGGSCSGCKEK